MKKIIESPFITKIFETKSTEFAERFGYYNYDPLSLEHKKLLCGRARFDGKLPPQKKGMCIDLVYNAIEDGHYLIFGESDSWNLQQGAVMQWVPGKEYIIIYNISVDNYLVSRIFDLETNQIQNVSWPIMV